METLGGLIIMAVLVLALSIATNVLRAHKAASARDMNLYNSAERELREAQDGIRKHARTDPTYRPRTIGGKR